MPHLERCLRSAHITYTTTGPRQHPRSDRPSSVRVIFAAVFAVVCAGWDETTTCQGEVDVDSDTRWDASCIPSGRCLLNVVETLLRQFVRQPVHWRVGLTS